MKRTAREATGAMTAFINWLLLVLLALWAAVEVYRALPGG